MRLQVDIEHYAMGFQVRISGDDAAFSAALAGLKERVPRAYRWFVPDGKFWHVDIRAARYLDRWIGEILDDGAEVYGDGEPLHMSRNEPATAPAPADPLAELYRELFLVPGAPMKLIEAARRILAVELHPDHGGEEEHMKRVNVAYDLIQQVEKRRDAAA